MQFSDEELIAYLLGDASAELVQRIQQQLATDAELLERLSQFRLVLGQIDSLGGVFEPPADLVDTTLARIDSYADSGGAAAPNDDSHHDEIHHDEIHEVESLEEFTAGNEAKPVWLSVRGDNSPRRSSMWDSTALTVCVTILCCMALPALVRVRFESRKAQCARNLKLTGTELTNYALNNPQGRFPFVAVDGPEAFAGVYAVHLRDAGVDLTASQLRCASLLGTEQVAPLDQSMPQHATSIPGFAELHQLAVHELRQWQQTIGGDYAYCLGVAERGRPHAPKCEGRSQFAILADAPVIDEGSRGQQQEEFIAHEGKGINIFYEDGRVVFVSAASLGRLANSAGRLVDNPFKNQHGAHELGLHRDDASLAPSHFSPLGQ